MEHAPDPALFMAARLIGIAIAAAAGILVCDHFWPPGPRRKRKL